MNKILIIAATDNSSGAGLTKDVIVSKDHNVWPIICPTSITTQDFSCAYHNFILPQSIIKKQLNLIKNQFNINAIKIGVINESILPILKDFLSSYNKNIHIILDPIIKASNGIKFIKNPKIFLELLKYVTILTPNFNEFIKIFNLDIDLNKNSKQKLIKHSKEIAQKYNLTIILKGGHLNISKTITDYVVTPFEIKKIKHKRIEVKNFHGSGCTLSTALACNLALGYPLLKAFKNSLSYLKKFYLKIQNNV